MEPELLPLANLSLEVRAETTLLPDLWLLIMDILERQKWKRTLATLLRANRAIHRLGLPMLYKSMEITPRFADPAIAEGFIGDALGSQKHGYVRRIKVCKQSNVDPKLLERILFPCLGSAQKLWIQATDFWSQHPNSVAFAGFHRSQVSIYDVNHGVIGYSELQFVEIGDWIKGAAFNANSLEGPGQLRMVISGLARLPLLAWLIFRNLDTATIRLLGLYKSLWDKIGQAWTDLSAIRGNLALVSSVFCGVRALRIDCDLDLEMHETKEEKEWTWLCHLGKLKYLTLVGLNTRDLPRVIRSLPSAGPQVSLICPVFDVTPEETMELISVVKDAGGRLQKISVYGVAKGPAIPNGAEQERWETETDGKIEFMEYYRF